MIQVRSFRKRLAWHCVWAALIGSAFSAAYAFFFRPVSASTQLVVPDHTFKTEGDAANFVTLATSTGAWASVSKSKNPHLSPESLLQLCTVAVVPNSPLIELSATAPSSQSARALLDALAEHVRNCGEDWVASQLVEVDRQLGSAQLRLQYLRKQFSDFDEALISSDIQTLHASLANEVAKGSATVKSLEQQLASVDAEEKKVITVLTADRPALRTVQQELDQALVRYTEEHPRVKELRASLAALQKEGVSRTSQSGASTDHAQLAELNMRRDQIREQLVLSQAAESKCRQSLQKFAANEIQFAQWQSEFSALQTMSDELVKARVAVDSKRTGKWQLSERAKFTRVASGSRLYQFGCAGGMLGLGLGAITGGIAQRRRRFIRNPDELSQATGLPVLATLPNLSALDISAREYWAVETLKCLRTTVRTSRHGSLICGFIAARTGDGCSTWIDLLAKAGLRTGNRVLVVSQPSTSSLPATIEMKTLPAAETNNVFALQPATSPETHGVARYNVNGDPTEPRFQKYWEHAFDSWQHEEDALVLVELPPASSADALVLSSAVPHLVWVSSANTTETRETVERVRSLKRTGCNLIGAVLNRASASYAALIILLMLLMVTNTFAQEKAKPGVPTLAPWQQRLTLGAGDVFDVSIHSQADSLRSGITIGPDGRMSYLQARDVEATGLTIDELRAKLENILGKFHLAPRVVIAPVAFRSKKYFLLGNVTQPGAFILDRPITIVEAIAKARGFVSAVQQRSSFTTADLTHSFLIRKSDNGDFVREPVDFERLFRHGELEQNRYLAPDDYLYFPPLGLEEIYVLGEVATTGVVPYTKNLTVLGAIAGRGGFKDGAFRQKILVIRGSLNRPEVFAFGTNGVQQLQAVEDATTPTTTIIDTAAGLRAAAIDFALQPRDIVYVSRKPWAKAEELLEAASSDFVRAVVVSWTGQHIKPLSR